MPFINRVMMMVYEACYGGKKEFRMLFDQFITRGMYGWLFLAQSYVAQVLAEPEFSDRFASFHAHEWAVLGGSN